MSSLTARFLPAAETEFLKEIKYYSDFREGYGIRFQQAVMSAVELALAHPQAGVPSPKNTRSRRVRGFPFSLIYRVRPGELLVVALSHHRRQPMYWLQRIK